MKHGFWTSLAHTFRRTALPLAAYYAVTLALPIANGAARSGAFVRHALVVLLVPLIGVFLTVVVNTVVRSLAADPRRRAAPRNGSAARGDFHLAGDRTMPDAMTLAAGCAAGIVSFNHSRHRAGRRQRPDRGHGTGSLPPYLRWRDSDGATE